MSRHLNLMAPVVSVSLALALLAGCGVSPNRVQTATTVTASSAAIKSEAEGRKVTRAQNEERAKQLIATFDDHNWRSIDARTKAVEKIAATDSNASYDFLLEEATKVQDLRDQMKNITEEDANTYEEAVGGLIDKMTPDQSEVKKRVAKAESLHMDLDELTITEENQSRAEGTYEAKWAGQAGVGTRNRLLTAIQESKVYKFVKRAYRNTRHWIKGTLHSICQKLHFCS
jgi:hypothetical protein